MRRTSLLSAVVTAAIATAASMPAATPHPLHGSARGTGYDVVSSLPLPESVRAVVAPEGPAPAPTTASADSIPRATKDRPDLVEGPSLHAVYLVASDGPDEPLDTNGTLHRSVTALERWFQAHTGGLQWRWDMARVKGPGGEPREVVDVSFVRATRDAATLGLGISEIRDELIEQGFEPDGTRYVVFAQGDTGGICGQAYWRDADDPGHTRLTIPAEMQYSAVFLDADPGCHGRSFAADADTPGWVEATVLQEILHNDGLVPATAPNLCLTTTAHVCIAGVGEASAITLLPLDPQFDDVMFPYVTAPLTRKSLDDGNDDYFRRSTRVVGPDLVYSPYLVGN